MKPIIALRVTAAWGLIQFPDFLAIQDIISFVVVIQYAQDIQQGGFTGP